MLAYKQQVLLLGIVIKQKGISMIRPKIGLDWDDVTAPFNSIAIDMANKNIILPRLFRWRT